MTDPRSEPIILLVEDNPNDVELILHVFQWCNLETKVEVVRDGEQALDRIFGTGRYAENPLPRPKVILLDLKLPKMSGIDVLKRLKESSETRNIPVVVLTSSGEERDIVESYNLGVNSYIVKPVNFNEFVSAIRDLVLYWDRINLIPSQ